MKNREITQRTHGLGQFDIVECREELACALQHLGVTPEVRGGHRHARVQEEVAVLDWEAGTRLHLVAQVGIAAVQYT